ncbi:hypothetical protein ACH42_02250 [Endozoicomonas sp. (ex Bugula neritina AB1)]|nr:hypothetical protein ACH42_02250 [Endozoicomonas sp. (ex Bugula neritina AB1)]
MKPTIFLPLLLAVMISSPLSADNGGLESLRSDNIAEQSPSAAMQKIAESDGPMKRDFVQQPPLIPHDIRGYEVNKNVNTCLHCHNWKNADKFGATKISVTHFYNRDGKQLADVAPGRYFCLQCHVTQTHSQPLKENTFEPVDSLK